MTRKGDWTEVDLPDAAETEANSNLLAIFWRRKWIIACVPVITLALGYLYFLKSTPVYQSKSQILLIKQEAALPIPGVEGYENTLSTHILVLSSPLVVGKAVKEYHLASLSSLQGTRNPIAAIISGLDVTRGGGRKARHPNIIDLTYEGPDPRDCATVLNAIIESYEGFLGDTYQDFSEETVRLISDAKDVLDKQLREKEAAYRKFREESPLLWKGEEGVNLHEARMVRIEGARSQTLVNNANTRAQIDAIETALKQGGNRAALALLVGQSASPGASRNPIGSFNERLFAMLLEEQMLLESYGPDYPKVMAVRRKMNLMREYLGNISSPDTDEPTDFLAIYVESLRQELKVEEEKRREYDALFQQEREAAKALAGFQLADESYRNEIARMKQMFNGVIKRLEEINLVKDYGGINTQVMSPPGIGRQVQPKLALILMVSGVLGLLAGLGLGYVVDVADNSFRGPDDIRRQLGLPLVGHIPVIRARRGEFAHADDEDAKALPQPVLCTFHQPKSRYAEAYRAVRTSLYFSTRAEGHKVIQVTSPDDGDGKTTLATNLAVSIANSGKSVLLIDVDFRHPSIHAFLALKNTVGASSVLAGDAKVSESTQETVVEHLWAMTSGPNPHNPAELLTSPRLKELIDAVREKYEFVIIDSPPLLAVTDPSVVAPRVDAVLLVMRLTKTARAGMTQAVEILKSLGIKVLGVVVNGVGTTAAYGYGGYGYRYGDKYRSGRDGENVYYFDEKSALRPLGAVFRKLTRRGKLDASPKRTT